MTFADLLVINDEELQKVKMFFMISHRPGCSV